MPSTQESYRHKSRYCNSPVPGAPHLCGRRRKLSGKKLRFKSPSKRSPKRKSPARR